MKKTLIICVLFFIFISLTYAQTKKDSIQSAITSLKKEKISSLIKNAENLKSGNYKDVLYSFFQLAAKDLTGQNKSFGFNSTLFAIKLKLDSTLNRDYNLKNQNFARNFQFNFKLNLDTAFKFKGFTSGFTFAIVNQRDHQLADFSESYLGKVLYPLLDTIQKQSSAYTAFIVNQNLSREKRVALLTEMQSGIDSLFTNYTLSYLPEAFFNGLKYPAGLISSLRKIDVISDSLYKELDKKWLWTIKGNASSNKTGRFNRANLETIILKGKKPELDIRAGVYYADTLVKSRLSRFVVYSSAGFNLPLLITKRTNIIEFKPYLEYTQILKNLLPNEENYRFLANADLRFRITEGLWLPLTLKYDLKNGNFLGFLNVSINLNGINSN
ncbi:hypothetical protein [Pedobacter mendelii]|uniref:Uncharacterized protein n=1 Tax=Pedobacter mendelii TaxID=1908240 RepID=A0ABQ2BI90_9SPHI|nr:hypothetical protein [Pedobacter mendelii]GGI24575.1 hypothetical protein GCM10008119_13340 [Pedobacter mendelii]